MKVKKTILILAFVIFSTNLTLSQNLEGFVVYQVSLDSKAFIDRLKKDTITSEKIKNAKIARAFSAKPMNFILLFNENESIYNSQFDLNAQRNKKMGSNETGLIAGDYFTYYNNIITKENFKQNFFMDKLIISVEPIKWKLTQEIRLIGRYTCYKAIATLKEEREHGGFLSDKIIAWYTPEIPVPFGIQNFTGLPGLTIELNIETENGELFYKAFEIELNPQEKVIIKKLKGNEITHKKYIEIISNSVRF